MKRPEIALEKIQQKIEKTTKKIASVEIDAHWYRRVVHAWSASFLLIYLIPNWGWAGVLKFWFPLIGFAVLVLIEIFRIKGWIAEWRFFGLRVYEKKRPGGYMYFVIGFLILFYLFPQQIAIPCILCACFADPLMGELRFRYGKQGALLGGFGLCFLLFIITWIQADPWVILVVALIGAACAVAGEIWKSQWIDDDFLIQILPAVALALLWQIMLQLNGVTIVPPEILISW